MVDEILLQELFDRIAHLTGDAILEKLNVKICQRFLIAPLAVVFTQEMTDELLCSLISRDQETSKQIFQLLMYSLSENA